MRFVGEMSEKQAERIIEEFDNGMRNGEQWAHDVCLHRGTLKYENCLSILNEAYKIKSVDRQVQPLAVNGTTVPLRKRMRR